MFLVEREQGGCRCSSKMCLYRLSNETKKALSFLDTSCAGGPDPLTPLPPWYPPGASGDEPVNYTESYGSFGDVVGRIDIGLGDKGKVFSSVGAKAFGQDGGLSPCFGAAHLAQKFISLSFQSSPKRIGWYFFVLVDEPEKRFESIEDALAIVGDGLGRRLSNKTSFANQMG